MAVEAYRPTHRVRFAGRASKLAATGLGETVSALSESAARVYRRTVRWLDADPREVVRIRRATPPPGALAGSSAHGTHRLGPGGVSASGSEDAAALSAGELAGDLGRFRTRVARSRAAVVLRRQLSAAALLGVGVQAFVLAGLIPQWALLAVLAPLGLALTLALRRPVALEGVARLLDERLALFDQLATALELERRGSTRSRPLERRAVARASALLRTDSPQWRVSARRAKGEWLCLGACLALLALLVGLNASGAVGAGSGSRAGIGPGLGAGQNPSGGTRRGKTGAKAHGPRSHQRTASTNLNRLPGTATMLNRSGQVTKSSQLERRQLPATTHGLHSNGKATGAEKGSTTASRSLQSSSISPVPRSSPTNGSSAHHAPTASRPGRGAAAPSTKPSSPRPSGQHGAAGRQASSRGHTPGGNTAGHAPGSLNRLLSGGKTRGRVSLQLKLSLAAGYVRIHSSHTGEFGKGAEKIEGGGGRGRSAAVRGEASASSAGAGGFAYVPPDGGARTEGRTSLLDRYFSHLRWIEQELASW